MHSRLFNAAVVAVSLMCIGTSQGTPHAAAVVSLALRDDGLLDNLVDATPTSAGESTTAADEGQVTTTAAAVEPTTTAAADDSSSAQAEPTTSEEAQPTTTENAASTTDAAADPTSTDAAAVPSTTSSSAVPETTSEASVTDGAGATSTANEGPSSTETGKEKETGTTTAKPVVSTTFATITMTNSDGTKETTTSAKLTTSTPSTQDGSSSDDEGGMSPSTRKVVIGVVVGIGGAIIAGALAVVAWRIRSRKRAGEEADGLMGMGGMGYTGGYASVGDKAEDGLHSRSASHSAGRSLNSPSPFQATLEEHHQPGHVNASSNF